MPYWLWWRRPGARHHDDVRRRTTAHGGSAITSSSLSRSSSRRTRYFARCRPGRASGIRAAEGLETKRSWFSGHLDDPSGFSYPCEVTRRSSAGPNPCDNDPSVPALHREGKSETTEKVFWASRTAPCRSPVPVEGAGELRGKTSGAQGLIEEPDTELPPQTNSESVTTPASGEIAAVDIVAGAYHRGIDVQRSRPAPAPDRWSISIRRGRHGAAYHRKGPTLLSRRGWALIVVSESSLPECGDR